MSKYNMYVEDVSVEAVFNKLGGVVGAKRFLADEPLLVEAPPPEPPPEPVLDFLVRVDRSVKPSYPNWFSTLENPELECSGPTEYNLQDGVEQWLANGQESVVRGDRVYGQLKKEKALASCLNLQDGLAIQQKGIAVFRKLFAGKAVFLWGSVVNREGTYSLHVPYLYGGGGEVVVRWLWLDHLCHSIYPALRFSKPATAEAGK